MWVGRYEERNRRGGRLKREIKSLRVGFGLTFLSCCQLVSCARLSHNFYCSYSGLVLAACWLKCVTSYQRARSWHTNCWTAVLHKPTQAQSSVQIVFCPRVEHQISEAFVLCNGACVPAATASSGIHARERGTFARRIILTFSRTFVGWLIRKLLGPNSLPVAAVKLRKPLKVCILNAIPHGISSSSCWGARAPREM